MPATQRKNITCACAGCRVAKVRCDGRNPCDRCSLKGLQCFYPSQKKRGFPKRSSVREKSKEIEKERNKEKELTNKSEPLTNNENTELVEFDPLMSDSMELEYIDDFDSILPELEIISSFDASANRSALLSIYLGNFHVEKYALVSSSSLIQPTTESDNIMQMISLSTSARSLGKFYLCADLEGALEDKVGQIRCKSLDTLIAYTVCAEYFYTLHAHKSEEYSRKARELYYSLQANNKLIENGADSLGRLICIQRRLGNSHISCEPSIEADAQRLVQCFLAGKVVNFSSVSDIQLTSVTDTMRSCFLQHTHRLEKGTELLSIPPWVTVDQYIHLKVFLELMEKQLWDVQRDKPVMNLYTSYPQVLLCFIEEAVNNYEQSARYAMKAMNTIRKNNVHLPYASMFLIINLQALFKYYLRHADWAGCEETLAYMEMIGAAFPRVAELCEENKARIRILESQPNPDVYSLFHPPVSLTSVVEKFLSRRKTEMI